MMSQQQLELSSETQCSLCDLFYSQSQKPFIIYKCFCCLKLTPVCLSCELILQRILGKGNLFKCIHCNKLTSSLDKFEINPSNQQNIINQRNFLTNSSFFKTPIKSFLDNNSNNAALNSFRFNEERKDDSSVCPNNNPISTFVKEFSLFDIGKNSNSISNLGQIENSSKNNINNINFVNSSLFTNINKRNIAGTSNFVNRTLTSSNSVNDLRKNNDFSLLKQKRRINRRFCLKDISFLGRKRDDSFNLEDSRGYEKSKDKVIFNNGNRNILGTVKPKKLITKKMSRLYSRGNDENNTNALTKCKFGLISDENNFRREDLKFNGNFANPFENCLNMNNNNLFINQNGLFGQGMNAISGTATPHKFYTNTNNDEIYF